MHRKWLALLVSVGLIGSCVPLMSCQRQNATPQAAPAASTASQVPALALNGTSGAALYTEPEAGFAWAYALVNNARTTLDLTMYELVDTTFSNNLVAACGRGVVVRVILDGNQERISNTPAYNQIAAAGPNCSVAWSNTQFPATHEKSMVIDGNVGVVMTFNLTSRYYAETRDFAIIDTDPVDVSALETTFNKDFQSTTDGSFAPPMGHNLIWSPTTAKADLVGLIRGAKKTLSVENEELSAAEIVSALKAACKRGVQVQLTMTDTNPNYHANFTALETAGCGVHVGANNESTLYVHAKAMVADLGLASAVGYVGSINFSEASMTQNRELGVYVRDTGVLGQLSSAMAGDYNQFPAYSAASAVPSSRPALP